ncbi:hypothetical protein J3R74_002173 [Puniceicoccus vermicola]
MEVRELQEKGFSSGSGRGMARGSSGRIGDFEAPIEMEFGLTTALLQNYAF